MPAPTRSVFDFPVPAFMRTAAGSLKPDQAPTFAGFSVPALVRTAVGSLKPDQAPTFAGFSVPAFMRTVVVVTGDF